MGQRVKYKFKTTGPFALTGVDESDSKYLLLTFNDGFTRKLAKGGNWPPEYAVACLNKANELIGKEVFIKTSQTTKDWSTTQWLCDIQAATVAAKSQEIARALEPNKSVPANDSIDKYILTSCTTGKSFFANVAPVADYFSSEEDFLDFSNSFEQGFVSAWTAKNARTAKLPSGMRRVRIGGLGNRTKRNGFRVVAAEVQTDDTSEAFRFFHILRIDEKTEREEYLTDAEIKEVTQARTLLEQRYPKGLVSWYEERPQH
jgi:hypothetical protein